MTQKDSTEQKTVEHYQFQCKNCGYELDHEIGKNSLVCNSCGQVEPIDVEAFNIFHAHPYETTVMKLVSDEPSEVRHHVRCDTCGAGFDFPKNTHADECPYCGQNIIVPVGLQRQLKPDAVLPFDIAEEQANDSFKKWLKSLWFAPNALKKMAMKKHPIQGTYVPYWGFDADTTSHYSGQRGTNYTTTVTVTINGRRETRLVTKIRWEYVSGNVSHEFDNVLIPSSDMIAKNLTASMQKWNLVKSEMYNPKFLSGYKSELYQVGLPRGFGSAKGIMTNYIRRLVSRNIGGDHQRIESINSNYQRVGFKLILMPLWISAFLYNHKTYRFIINGQTGEVKGERPYSWVKIISLILFIFLLISVGVFLGQNK